MNQCEKKLIEILKIQEKDIKTRKIKNIHNYSLRKIEEMLLRNINVIDDSSEKYLIFIIKAGFANLNETLIGCELDKDSVIISGYAREGLIKQNTCEKAFNKIEDCIRK